MSTGRLFHRVAETFSKYLLFVVRLTVLEIQISVNLLEEKQLVLLSTEVQLSVGIHIRKPISCNARTGPLSKSQNSLLSPVEMLPSADSSHKYYYAAPYY